MVSPALRNETRASKSQRALTLRLKIFIITTVLLTLFAIANMVSVLLNKEVTEELDTMAEYQIPLQTLTADIDVETFEFELNLRRLLQESEPGAARLAAIVAQQHKVAKRLEQAFEQASQLLTAGIEDARHDVPDRIALARIAGTFSMIQRDIKPFLQLGMTVLNAIQEQRLTDAQQLIQGFAAFEQAFGADLAEIRLALGKLTQSAALETHQNQLRILQLDVALFIVAALLGLGVSAVMTQRLSRSLRHLLDATQAVEAGQLTVELRINASDEIGQLAQSFNHMVDELRTKEHIKDTFGKFMDPRIVSGLLGMASENPDAAERRTITVFFSDIKGFSTISEQLTASAMVHLLNAYFGAVTQVIRDHNGVVDKYVGDGVMAFWTPPFSSGDQHAADACLAALEQQQAIAAFREELPQLLGLRRHVPDFMVRMGLATGEVVIGTIGSATAKSYTVIGDIVNVASRLEGINKLYGTEIVIAEDTYRLVHQAVEARELDLVTVVGKTEPIRIFELLGQTGTLAPERVELCGLFAEGLAAYRLQNWDLAERKFHDCLKLIPEDAPARLFRQRIAFLRTSPLPPDWHGVWQATEK
jgi:adenylate cyclase